MIAVFDLDYTLVTCNSSYWFCNFLHRQKVFPTWALCRAYWHCLRYKFSSKELKLLHSELFHSILKGLSMDNLKKFIVPYVRDCILANLYFPVFQELRLAQHCGTYTVIMSSSPSFLVSQAALALDVDEWIATDYEVDHSQRLVSIRNFIDGEAKAVALQKLAKKRDIPLEEVVAYSDSYRDLPLLQLAGKAVAVNPDAKLEAVSLENKWRIV